MRRAAIVLTILPGARFAPALAWQAMKRLQIMDEALASVEGAVSEAASDFRLA
jgi:hypothetical protein